MDPIVIERLDRGPRLVIEEPATLALHFFSTDASSVAANSYDAQAGKGEPDRITSDDIRAINQTMRARSPHSAWEALTGAAHLPWLGAIDPAWDLIATDDETWQAVGGPVLLAAAIEASVGPYRRLSVATKVLHLKRPRLFPVLDSLVVDLIGGLGFVSRPSRLLIHLREQGRANLTSLTAIQRELADHPDRYERSLVRILDALLWSSHPTAGIAPGLKDWEHRIRPVST
ncbi:MAG TPA: DUF6308 family protein [Candidatus Limnocylindria bacterium]|nr:DUF6308 family protein [Candidatus Limnocylindria bacterium]